MTSTVLAETSPGQSEQQEVTLELELQPHGRGSAPPAATEGAQLTDSSTQHASAPGPVPPQPGGLPAEALSKPTEGSGSCDQAGSGQQAAANVAQKGGLPALRPAAPRDMQQGVSAPSGSGGSQRPQHAAEGSGQASKGSWTDVPL